MCWIIPGISCIRNKNKVKYIHPITGLTLIWTFTENPRPNIATTWVSSGNRWLCSAAATLDALNGYMWKCRRVVLRLFSLIAEILHQNNSATSQYQLWQKLSNVKEVKEGGEVVNVIVVAYLLLLPFLYVTYSLGFWKELKSLWEAEILMRAMCLRVRETTVGDEMPNCLSPSYQLSGW